MMPALWQVSIAAATYGRGISLTPIIDISTRFVFSIS